MFSSMFSMEYFWGSDEVWQAKCEEFGRVLILPKAPKTIKPHHWLSFQWLLASFWEGFCLLFS